MEQAAEVRDRDIALLLLSERVAVATDELQQQFRIEREKAAATLAASLTRWVQRGLHKSWRDASRRHRDSAPAAARLVGITARRLLPGLAKDYFAFGKRAARDKASAKELHQFRITAKTLRYTLDLFSPPVGTSRGSLYSQILGIQKLLGDVNDCETLRRLLSHKKGTRRIIDALEKRQNKKTEQFRRKWKNGVSDPSIVRLWLDDLRHTTMRPPGRSARVLPRKA
jgi:CHAD domain-containing protein